MYFMRWVFYRYYYRRLWIRQITMKINDNNVFEKRLWRAGFVTVFGKQVIIDKVRACGFLHCSRRTLDRWIQDNQPCPRAVALLDTLPRLLPDSWQGFAFTRDEKLIWQGLKNGFSASEVRQLPAFVGRSMQQEQQKDNYQALIAELVDSSAGAQLQRDLLRIGNELAQLSRTPVIRAVNAALLRGNS